jgi:hypothetical protein
LDADFEVTKSDAGRDIGELVRERKVAIETQD